MILSYLLNHLPGPTIEKQEAGRVALKWTEKNKHGCTQLALAFASQLERGDHASYTNLNKESQQRQGKSGFEVVGENAIKRNIKNILIFI